MKINKALLRKETGLKTMSKIQCMIALISDLIFVASEFKILFLQLI